jgi:hypothetical protein
MKQEVGLRRKHHKVHSEHSDHSERSEGRGGGSECEGEIQVATGHDRRWGGCERRRTKGELSPQYPTLGTSLKQRQDIMLIEYPVTCCLVRIYIVTGGDNTHRSYSWTHSMNPFRMSSMSVHFISYDIQRQTRCESFTKCS